MAFKVIYTTSDKLPEITLAPGQLIFTQDDRKLQFVNNDGNLTNYTAVVSLATEQERADMANPYPALFWVRETAKLWRYETTDGWVRATADVEGQIVFGPLPAVGETDKLYIDGLDMYVWFNNEFIKINGGGSADLDWLPIE